MKVLSFLTIIILTLCMLGCQKLSIGEFDIKFGTGNEAWSNDNGLGPDGPSRGNAYRDYNHDKWR